MILVVDIGNTNIVIGIYKEDKFIDSWRMVTRSEKTSDEYGVFILSLLSYNNIDYKEINGAIVSSVVPNLMHSFKNALKKYFNVNPFIVGPGIKTGIKVSIENPEKVGADRIVNVVAAYEQYGGPLIVIDFGTATTYDVVSKDGEFKCGVISAGIGITAEALWKKTAQLPSIEIKKTPSILAKNTTTSMQAGLVYGYIGQVEYIVKKIKEELDDENMKVIATGGLGRLISDETTSIDVYDSQLMLKGLKILHDKNIER